MGGQMWHGEFDHAPHSAGSEMMMYHDQLHGGDNVAWPCAFGQSFMCGPAWFGKKPKPGLDAFA